QNRCATRKELELQSFQRWIASSCPGGRGWVYHGELRCHSRLASQNRSTTKSSYGRIRQKRAMVAKLFLNSSCAWEVAEYARLLSESLRSHNHYTLYQHK